jgi:hypothetical protein
MHVYSVIKVVEHVQEDPNFVLDAMLCLIYFQILVLINAQAVTFRMRNKASVMNAMHHVQLALLQSIIAHHANKAYLKNTIFKINALIPAHYKSPFYKMICAKLVIKLVKLVKIR